MTSKNKRLAPSQTRAIMWFRDYLTDNLDTDEARCDVITLFDVEHTDYGVVHITARTEMVGLPVTNMLRALDRDNWFITIGKRGGVSAHVYPKSFDQFKGKKLAFNMSFK